MFKIYFNPKAIYFERVKFEDGWLVGWLGFIAYQPL